LILALFWFDRNHTARTSTALWLPTVWFFLACSRTVGQWLHVGPPESIDQYLEGNPFDRAVYTAMIAVGIVVLLHRGNRVAMILRTNWPILGFFLYGAVSFFWSDYPGVAFKRWIKALGDLVMVLIVLSDGEPVAAIRRLLARLAYTAIPLSILFIKYYPALGTMYSPFGGRVVYMGVTVNKNSLGAICVCFGLASLWRFIIAYQDRTRPRRMSTLAVHGAVLAMVLWLLSITHSMTASFSLLMAGTLLILTNLRGVIQRPAIVPALGAVMLVISVAVLFLGLSPGTLEAIGKDPTLTDRTELWTLLLGLVRNPLIGTGFDSFWLGPRLQKIWSVYWWTPNEAHNGYIEVFLNLGWIGIALLGAVLVHGYRSVLAGWRRNAQLGSLCIAYFMVGLVFNFTEAAFFKMGAPVWIFFLLAITGVRKISQQSSLRSGQSSRVYERPSYDQSHSPIAEGSCEAF